MSRVSLLTIDTLLLQLSGDGFATGPARCATRQTGDAPMSTVGGARLRRCAKSGGDAITRAARDGHA